MLRVNGGTKRLRSFAFSVLFISAVVLAILSAWPLFFIIFTVLSVSTVTIMYLENLRLKKQIEDVSFIIRNESKLLNITPKRSVSIEKTVSDFIEILKQKMEENKHKQCLNIKKEKLDLLNLLAGGIGHELRNPLGAIKNSIYFLNIVLANPQKDVREVLCILNEEIAQADKIIESLFVFARSGKIIRKQTDLNNLLASVLLRMDIPPDIYITRLFGEIAQVPADSEQLITVFENIIDNALKALPNGGNITVTTISIDRFVRIIIKDEGGGITNEVLQKVFEPLYTSRAKGIGLGLSIAKNIIEAHDGAVKLQSEVGKGTELFIDLPLSK